MRGPGLRATLDVRRFWRCPQCGYERRAPGSETSVRCHCSPLEPQMTLVEPRRGVRPELAVPDLYFEYVPTPEELEAEYAARVARELAQRQEDLAREAERAAETLPSPADEHAVGQVMDDRIQRGDAEDDFAAGLEDSDSSNAESETDAGNSQEPGVERKKRRPRRRRGKKPNG